MSEFMQHRHSKIIALCLFGLAGVLAYYGYSEDHSYTGRLMYLLTGAPSPLVQQYYGGAAIGLALAIFWAFK